MIETWSIRSQHFGWLPNQPALLKENLGSNCRVIEGTFASRRGIFAGTSAHSALPPVTLMSDCGGPQSTGQHHPDAGGRPEQSKQPQRVLVQQHC